MRYCQPREGLGYTPIDFTQALIAANGDTLNLEAGPFWVTVGDEWWDFGAETPIASGTGRIVGASGTLHEVGQVTPWWPPGFPYTATGNEPG